MMSQSKSKRTPIGKIDEEPVSNVHSKTNTEKRRDESNFFLGQQQAFADRNDDIKSRKSTRNSMRSRTEEVPRENTRRITVAEHQVDWRAMLKITANAPFEEVTPRMIEAAKIRDQRR